MEVAVDPTVEVAVGVSEVAEEGLVVAVIWAVVAEVVVPATAVPEGEIVMATTTPVLRTKTAAEIEIDTTVTTNLVVAIITPGLRPLAIAVVLRLEIAVTESLVSDVVSSLTHVES